MNNRPIVAVISVIAAAIGCFSFFGANTESVRTASLEAVSRATEPETKSASGHSGVRILFGGDMMFDRWIRTQARRKGNAFVFDGVRDLLRGHDLVVANLEGPITDRPSKSEFSEIGSRDNYRFTFDPSWAGTLSDEGMGPVSLGNNHIGNEGAEGITQTKTYLDSAGVAYFGDPMGDARVTTTDIRGIRIALVNYDEFETGGKDRTFSDIASVRGSSDIVILYAHWGTEYGPVRDDIRSLAHSFVDAGCDAVIGSHPHIVQDREEYSGKTIYYSLGNFVFDQYFREDTREGLLVSMSVEPDTGTISYREIPIGLRTDGSTEIIR